MSLISGVDLNLCTQSATRLPVQTHKNTFDTDSLFLNAFEEYKCPNWQRGQNLKNKTNKQEKKKMKWDNEASSPHKLKRKLPNTTSRNAIHMRICCNDLDF